MTGRALKRHRHPERLVVSGLWAGAALALVLGFAMRPLARFVGADLRMTSVLVIGAGLVLAIAGWLGEKLFTRKSP